MDPNIRREIEEEAERIEKMSAQAGPLERWSLKLKSFWIKLNLAFPVLVPAIVGGVISTVAFSIGSRFVAADHSKLLWFVCLAIGAIVALLMVKRNIDFIEFVKDYLGDKDDRDE